MVQLPRNYRQKWQACGRRMGRPGTIRMPECGGRDVVSLLHAFFALQLQTMKRVITEKRSDSIHKSTMILNCVNAGNLDFERM